MTPSSLLHFSFSSPLSFLFFSIIFLFFLLTISLATDYHYLQNCQPKSCGNLTNVTFPFWLRDRQPDYCGLPSFELRCDDETPKLIMALEAYHVLHISYKRRTATVSSAQFATKNNCSLPFNSPSFAFALTPFSISSLNRQLLFVYNCSLTKAGFLEIICNGNKSYAYLGGAYRMQDGGGLFGSCHAAVRPVLNSLGANVKQYPELLANGFLLNWTAPDCSECMRSRGQCGYNKDTRNFMCICGDRAHSMSCKDSSKTGLIIGLSTAGGFSFIVFCSLCFLIYRRCKKKQPSSSNFIDRSTSSAMSTDPELGSTVYTPIFSYDELYEATNGFDASKELGDGGFGTVYKGKLKDGRVVAVKRLYESNYRRGAEQFMNEVKIVSLLRHQNLVTLYGCTSLHSRELLLVYEFIPNGTVADHLHGSRASESFLPWNARMSIAVETADALNYLHSVEPQIIHRDIKTNNILLDNNFHVKVGDFGLSRLFPLDATHVSTAPQGTPGYVDPEYHKFFQLTDKSDVYSFGVVLMELISSMPAVDINRKFNEASLAYLGIKKIQRQELHEFVDPRLGFRSDPNVNAMVTQVAGLALQCLQSEREMRPGIKEVLENLRGIEMAGCKTEGSMEVDDAVKEEASLLKDIPPYSPDSVADRWVSTSSSMSNFSG